MTGSRVTYIYLLIPIVLVAFALACIIAPNEAHAAPLQTPKIVFIGDSYSIRSKKLGVSKPWPERVAEKLDIKKASRKYFRKSGYGFARNKKRFTTLLKNTKRDKTVTDVLIVGGAGNDRFTSNAKIAKWYRITIVRLRYLYPNARIMHAIINWHLTSKKYQRMLTAKIPVYKDAAKKYGVTYLTGCENVLHGKASYYSYDKHHANNKGQRAITTRLVKRIKAQNPRYAVDQVVKPFCTSSNQQLQVSAKSI